MNKRNVHTIIAPQINANIFEILLASVKILTMHSSHWRPVTSFMHWHRPVSLSQTSDSEPLVWHWQAAGEEKEGQTIFDQLSFLNGIFYMSTYNKTYGFNNGTSWWVNLLHTTRLDELRSYLTLASGLAVNLRFNILLNAFQRKSSSSPNRFL